MMSYPPVDAGACYVSQYLNKCNECNPRDEATPASDQGPPATNV